MSGAVPLPPSGWDFDSNSWPDDDCVAAGADLFPPTVVDAYRHGAFPMPDGRRLMWWSPLERGVLRPENLRISRSLRQSQKKFSIHFDTDFSGVIAACANPARSGGWIDSRIIKAYTRLHELGWAHSVEVRNGDGELVGGLYGLSIGHLFAGESMFHRETDASKVALIGLVSGLNQVAVSDVLIDTQWQTPHLASLGVSTMPRAEYLAGLSQYVDAPDLDWARLTTS